MSTFEDLGVVLHVLRVIRGLSQGELARLSGVRNSSISNYERGKSVPKLDTLEKLAQGLELPVSAMEEAQEFIRRMRSRASRGGASTPGRSSWRPDGEEAAGFRDAAALRTELDELCGDVGRVASRLTRVTLETLAARSLDSAPESDNVETPDGPAEEGI